MNCEGKYSAAICGELNPIMTMLYGKDSVTAKASSMKQLSYHCKFKKILHDFIKIYVFFNSPF